MKNKSEKKSGRQKNRTIRTFGTQSFCVIGLTPFGQTIARALEEQGVEVLVLDENREKVTAMSEIVTDALVGDPMKETTLVEAGVAGYSCVVVCLSDRINDSILLTMMLKDLGVPRVVVRAGSELECRVLERVGADEVVFPEQDMGRKLATNLTKGDVMEYLTYSPDYSIVECRVPQMWIGKSLIECNPRTKYGLNMIAVTDKEGIHINVAPDRVFLEEDILMLIGSNVGIDKIVKDH